MTTPRICANPDCSVTYTPANNHPGKIIFCRDCAVETTPFLMAKVYSINKHAAENVMEIVPRDVAIAFAASQRRNGGSSVIGSLVARKS